MIKLEDKNIAKEIKVNKLINFFLSEKFVFNKKNLTLLFNKLHELEYNYPFEKDFKIVFYDENSKTYKEMIKKGVAQFCDARRDYRIQTTKILFNTKENDFLSKWRLLNSYFHELEHEKQLDNICSKFKKNISDYEHLIRFSYIWGQELYHSEIIEIEAMIEALNKMLEILINNKKLINKDSIYALICDMLELQNCLNFYENEEVFKEIHTKFGKELQSRGIKFAKFEVNSKKIIELHSIAYSNQFLFWRNKKPITIENAEYKEKLQNIVDKKINSCYNNAFEIIYALSLKLFKPNKNDAQSLSCDYYERIKKSTNKLEIIELLYDNLADKFEDFKNDDEDQTKIN